MGAGYGGYIIKINSIENSDNIIGIVNKYVVFFSWNICSIGGL